MLGATSNRISTWETFKIWPVRRPEEGILGEESDNAAALKWRYNGKYVRAGIGRDCLVAADQNNITDWGKFLIQELEDYDSRGRIVALKCIMNGRYLRTGINGTRRLVAVSRQIGDQEKFIMTRYGDRLVVLEEFYTNRQGRIIPQRYISGENNRANYLFANRLRVTDKEYFIIYPINREQNTSLQDEEVFRGNDTDPTVVPLRPIYTPSLTGIVSENASNNYNQNITGSKQFKPIYVPNQEMDNSGKVVTRPSYQTDKKPANNVDQGTVKYPMFNINPQLYKGSNLKAKEATQQKK